MPNSKQEKHNTFFDDQKPLCNLHTFPSNGDDTLTTQSVMIKKQDDADRIYKDKNIMEMMYADGFVWNPTLKNGNMKFKFSRQISIDHVSHFNNDPKDVTKAYHKVGLRIGLNTDVDNKYLPLLGIVVENKSTKILNTAVTKLVAYSKKNGKELTYDEAFAIIG
jgi:hypothetical protein